jgi:hypothetical protein
MRSLRPSVVVLSLLTAAALGVGGCGGGDDGEGDGTRGAGATATAPAPGATSPGGSNGSGGGSGPRGSRALAADLAVVRQWATTLQRGDVDGAARLFALPSAVANGTRPIALTTRAQVRAFNRTLPCGADVLSARAAARGFFVVTFRLTERPGGDCGSGTGNTARAAFHVTDGLIDHWLRVEDLDDLGATPGTPS